MIVLAIIGGVVVAGGVVAGGVALVLRTLKPGDVP